MIPVTQAETAVYYPPSYANLEPRPVFRLRPPTPRSKRQYSQALTEEGLRFHSDAAVEAEIVRAMRELWTGDADLLAENEARLKGFNETVRQARKDPTVKIDPAEAEAIMLAVARLTDAWPMLRRMNADNQRFNADAPKIALGRFLCGWSNINLPFRLEDGAVPLEQLDALEREMDSIEEQAIADHVEGVAGIGFSELTLKALALLGLDQDTEKNSVSPSSPSDTLNGSTTDGSVPASANSTSVTTPSRPAPARKPRKKPASS